MPELPEVQTVVDNLNQQRMVGCTITGAQVSWPGTLADANPSRFSQLITGCRIRQITRRGKYIVFHLSHGLTMLIHLRMTGRLNWTTTGSTRNVHEHVALEVEKKNELRFQDTRKFGRIFLTRTPDMILGKLGPEPLAADFTGERFLKMLQTTRRRIKPLLLDQKFLAGMGNIYVDEALWQANIHPQRLSSSLAHQEIDALHQAISHVLRKGLSTMGTSLGSGKGNFYSVGNRPGRNADQLNVFRRTGKACPRCNTLIERIIVAQRSTHICPGCQQAP
jgi:formamidopyrimidine-DNA glycosylase